MSGSESLMEARYERLLGARIVAVKEHRNMPDTLVVEFEHRGTDDDSGYVLVDEAHVHFGSDDA